jgi:hypothetical protein
MSRGTGGQGVPDSMETGIKRFKITKPVIKVFCMGNL